MFSSPGRELKEARGPSRGCDITRELHDEETSPSSKGWGEGGGGWQGGCGKGPRVSAQAAASAASIEALTAGRPQNQGLNV